MMGHLVFGATTVALVAADFLRVGAPFAVALSTEAAIQLPREINLGSLAVRHNTLGGAGTITYTVHLDGVATALTLPLLAASASGSMEGPATIVVAPMTRIAIRATKAGLAVSPTNIVAAIGD